MAKKPGIPAVNLQDRTLNQVISAMKENIEVITGARLGVGETSKLEPTATLSDVITKVNDLIMKLNASGK